MNSIPKHVFAALWIIKAKHRLLFCLFPSSHYFNTKPKCSTNSNCCGRPLCIFPNAFASYSRMIISINWQIWKHITKQIFHQALSFTICGLKDIIIDPSISYSSFDSRTLSWCVQYELVTAEKVLLFKRTKGEKTYFFSAITKNMQLLPKYPHEDGHVKILLPLFAMFKKNKEKMYKKRMCILRVA